MPVYERPTLPDVGRWICVTIGDYDLKYKILQHGYRQKDIVAQARDESGSKCYQDEFFYRNSKWKYIEEPSSEDLDKAKEERLGYKCNHCNLFSTSLKMCNGCMEVRYCNKDCQTNDWDNHKDDCRKFKFVLKLNPRYPLPLGKVIRNLARDQKAFQDKLNKILKSALKGNFKVYIDGEWKTNPKATELNYGSYYALVSSANKEYTYRFMQNFLNHHAHSHSNQPSACALLEMLMMFKGQGLELHNLVYESTHENNLVGYTYNCNGTIWGMALNFNTFGTVAPFHPDCRCNYAKMPSKWRRERKHWDEIFSRAKADIKDVQCMDADTKAGCHAFGLAGDLGCQFKHDILVKEEMKGESDEANPKEKKASGEKPWQKRKKSGAKKKPKF